ncbi:MAG TPA: cytochrome c oxidase subunit II [Fimbriimonadaceae bacterium]|nr:cytochrome c oxidase subunit II [Fimbriimonadaceae bacterium]
MRPVPASEHAQAYDALFFTITGLMAFFTVLVVVLVIYFAAKYRKGSKANRRNPIDGHLPMEITWTAIPLVLAIVIFFWSTRNFLIQRDMPKQGIEIMVIGKQWMWHLEHMNGIRENDELHIPVGVPVKFTMISQDVLHAMYLPEFRTQYHVVPGRYTDLHFTPTKIGVYKMLCAMHCGAQHSEMVGKVYVMSQKDYAAWLEKHGNRFAPKVVSMAESGKLLFNQKGCANCHNDVNNERAPSLVGLIGQTRKFEGGGAAIADRTYVRDSIFSPYDQIVQGYENTMPSYKSQLTEEQVIDLYEYIKSLGNTPPPDGKKVPYEQSDRPPGIDMSSPDNATRTTNERESASATQFHETGDRK